MVMMEGGILLVDKPAGIELVWSSGTKYDGNYRRRQGLLR